MQTVLEVINPIESKKILGGDWYTDRWADGRSDGNGGMILTFHNGNDGSWASGAGTFGGTYDPFYDGSYTSDWYNYGNDNTGGGGDNGSNPIILQNLPASVPKQFFPGACVPTSASFVASFFGSSQTPEFMMHEYGLKNNMTPLQEALALNNGLGHDQQVAFLLQQFYMTGVQSISQMTNAIDNKHIVMAATIDNNGNGHEVTIVGYDNATSEFTIANTATGAYEQINYADISLSIQSWEITGVKP
ncbi:C39 family peptidase [Flavobacterium succinicans]|uniref:C39 family peptidase n=1 Tax=Flavobacterium succinicans TaxID=29536 RepID=UPI0018D3D06A|nr:C39 family peptidase [Flavobacterium succinicans]